MGEVVKASVNGPDLSFDERNLLSVSFKNTVSTLRSAWRNIQGMYEKKEESLCAGHLRKRVEDELVYYCNTVIDLLQSCLIDHPQATSDARVFYLKMAGDYYRYLSEFNPDDSSLCEQSSSFYDKAMSIAAQTMEPSDPVRLGLALNYSVCLYEIMKDNERAISLAQSSFDAAKESRLKDEDLHSSKDSELILQLLRDNLDLWNTLVKQEDDNMGMHNNM